MTDEPGPEQLLAMLEIARHDRAAIAVSHRIGAPRAAELAERITSRLDRAGIPARRRIWILAAAPGLDLDSEAAPVLAALADSIGSAPLVLHDPRDADSLIFRRRPPNQKRGGIYLNAQWMQATVRIACGPPHELAAGLSAWFNDPASLAPADLSATLVL